MIEVPTYHAGNRVAVLLPLPLASCYDYTVPPGMELQEGDIVSVPLGRRDVVGVVWKTGDDTTPADKIRPITARFDVPPMTSSLRHLIDWTAWYTMSLPGSVLKMALSVPDALTPPPPMMGYATGRSLEQSGLKITAGRKRVWNIVAEGMVLTPADLAREAGVGASVVRTLSDAAVLRPVPLLRKRAFPVPRWDKTGPSLSEEQTAVANDLRDRVGTGFSAILLEGVTGSGKTEVYFEAIAAALARGEQVLILLPEIALGTQWLERFSTRFGTLPAQWHSELSQGQRRRVWRAVAENDALVVVGARSALFLPFRTLGLIVVDEEHDASFKQEEGVTYHARDMAVVRGRFEKCPIVLSSATPSLETVVNVRQGKYHGLYLPRRHGGAELPSLHLIDMRRYSRSTGVGQRGRVLAASPSAPALPQENTPQKRFWLAPPLAEAIAETLARGEQSLLFLNRRGYAPLTLCQRCGFRMQCRHCASWLVEHRALGRLICHHCGFFCPPPTVCPQCSSEDSFAVCGPGIERLAEEVALRFPQCRASLLASDMNGGPAAMRDAIAAMENGTLDMMIGTQIIAKGYHFPRLTLVGVVDADLGLAGGDLRAAERTYQLLSQVAGRAGREKHPGHVYLQSYTPEHPVLQAQIHGNFQEFIDEESRQREALSMPPFGRLAALIVSSESEAKAETVARALARQAPRIAGMEVLGPVPAPMAFLRNRYRFRLLVKTLRQIALQPEIHKWLERTLKDRKVRIHVDIDPYSFF